MNERKAYRITGRVQGVGFRWWARESARRLGLRGLIRNEADGSVFIEVEGDADAMGQFRRLLETGPPGAVVHGMREETTGPGDLPSRFEIAR
jgi:acylphosphatase